MQRKDNIAMSIILTEAERARVCHDHEATRKSAG
jgi:hypothetical protein